MVSNDRTLAARASPPLDAERSFDVWSDVSAEGAARIFIEVPMNSFTDLTAAV
jgi:hypothetical protein